MCYTLQSITIPASVEFIYQEAFANCPSLKKIETLSTTPPFLYDNSFTSFSVPVKVVLHRNGVIPASCRASRRSLK